jgi:hypothetical protein
MKTPALLAALLGLVPVATFTADESPPAWTELPDIRMKGGLRAYWDVGGDHTGEGRKQAEAHGFERVLLLNSYADYPGKQQQAIRAGEGETHANPWRKPDYFESIIKRNIAARGNDGALFVHDIEFSFEEDAAKAWADPAARTASGAKTLEEFQSAYLREWASWFALPCQWAKERYPTTPVGIYGPQPFRRDYWGVAGKSAQQIDGTHRMDHELWQHIDPFVDYYIASVYFFYEEPGSLYYLASNIEENRARTRRFGDKPVYAYEWMRYHNSNKELSGQELSPWLVEAMAVVPYFSGARGVVLWGWEPKVTGQPYHRMPIFLRSLDRVARHSEKLGSAELVIDEPAPVLWKEKRPLVRKLRVSDDEWFVLAIDPHQKDDAVSTIQVAVGARTVPLEMRGRHTEIYHLTGDRVERVE